MRSKWTALKAIVMDMKDNPHTACYPETWASYLNSDIDLCKPNIGQMCNQCAWDLRETRQQFLNQIEESVKYEQL